MIATLRLLGHHPLTDIDQLLRCVRPIEKNVAGFLRLVLDEPLRERALRKRRMSGEKEVERAAQRINIGPMIEIRRFQSLLGGHVIDGPKRRFAGSHAAGLFAAVEPSQAEVENLDYALGINQ